jgi:hypothetical protein
MKENKLIADFMGVQYKSDEDYFKELTEMREDGIFYEQGYMESQLNYHESWDWLIPVVEKIEEHGYDFIASKRRATRTYDANFMDEVNNYVVYVEDCKDRKEATYKAVVGFIKNCVSLEKE